MTIRGLRWTLAMGGALVAAWGLSACGGDAESDGSGSSGGAAGAGASGVGGSGASGVGGSGASGVGGSGTAGTVGVGGSGTAGTGGVGGVGGAGGTGGALPEEWFACSDTSQCAVRRNECCELCGPETTGEALAYNVAHGTELEAALCENEPGGCPDIACELAPQWILPLCTSGRCKALDIREDLLTSCGDNSQCRLRWGTTCCEWCGDAIELLVAVNNQVNYEATVCGMTGGACPPCAPPPYPPNARAVCGANHHCEVVFD